MAPSIQDLGVDRLIKNNFNHARHALSSPMSDQTGASDNYTNIPNFGAVPYTHGLTGVDITLDRRLVASLWLSIAFVLLVISALRAWQLINSHLRQVSCLTATAAQQNYWKSDRSRFWPWLKREVIYAPLWRKRHNREIQLSSATNYGTLPGRLHTFLLLVYVLSNAIFCALLDYRTENRAALFAELRGRTGILATVNMIPLIALSGRNNPAIIFLRVGFDTFNLFHRWVGRIVILESVVHVIAWYVNYSAAKGQKSTSQSFTGDPFLQYGLISVVTMLLVGLQSLSPVRHAFYETFLHLHQFLAFLVILGLYFHLSIPNLPALPYARIALILWLLERLFRVARIIYLNTCHRRGRTSLVVEALPGAACRLTFQLPRTITIRPGSHIYVYIPRIAFWMSHPFSVAWTNIETDPWAGTSFSSYGLPRPTTFNSLEKRMSDTDTDYQPSKGTTTVSLIVVARTGMTRKLYERASRGTNGSIEMSAFLEGPYAGHDSLASYGTVIMFAGGAGITHHLVQIRHLLSCAQAQTVATRKITLVWSFRDVEVLSWVRPWMDEILEIEGRKDILKVMLYVTRPRCQADYQSPHQTMKLNQGRCVPLAILDEELPSRIGATMVTVCGPGAFADEVRAAVRKRIYLGCIDLNEESFTW